jgi:hypothetical protein
MNVRFFLEILEKYISIKFHANPFSRSRVVPCGRRDGQTDMTKLRLAFQNFAKALRIKSYFFSTVQQKAGLSNADELNLQKTNT